MYVCVPSVCVFVCVNCYSVQVFDFYLNCVNAAYTLRCATSQCMRIYTKLAFIQFISRVNCELTIYPLMGLYKRCFVVIRIDAGDNRKSSIFFHFLLTVVSNVHLHINNFFSRADLCTIDTITEPFFTFCFLEFYFSLLATI